MVFGEILTYSVIAGAAMLLGTALVLYFEEWSHRNSIFLLGFAAGVMLTIAFANLIPAAQSLHANALVVVFIGFLALYTVQEIIMFHPCHDEICETHKMGVFSFVGLSIHSLLDGAVVAVGLEAGTALGLLTTLAVILHKIPDGITITSILVHARTPRARTVFLSSLVALATPLGAIVSFFYLRGVSYSVLGILLALTAGSFIYLAAADLLPEAHKIKHRATAVFFFLGVAVIIGLDHLLH